MQKNIITICSALALVFVVACTPQTTTNSQSKFSEANCDSLNDLAKALPDLENYKDYQIQTVTCLHSSRSYFLIYINKKDSLSEITIHLRDCSIKENDVFLIDVKQSFDNAMHNYKGFRVSKLMGQFASIYNDTISQNGHILAISKFNAVLKSKYAFQIIAKENLEVNRQLQFDSFIKDFVAKTDPSILK